MQQKKIMLDAQMSLGSWITSQGDLLKYTWLHLKMLRF